MTMTLALRILTLPALLAVSPLSAQASTVLFADTFDRPDSADLNASSVGKSGTLGALTWIKTFNRGHGVIESNRLTFHDDGAGGGWVTAYLDHNFIDPGILTEGGFTVSVDLVSPDSMGGTRFTGFSVGNALTHVQKWPGNNPADFPSDFFIGYDPTTPKEVKIFLGGKEDFRQAVDLSEGATLSVRFSGITGFEAGSTVNYEASINGNAVKTGSFTWSGTNENYINLFSNFLGQKALVDNITIRTGAGASPGPNPAPEPEPGFKSYAWASPREGGLGETSQPPKPETRHSTMHDLLGKG